MYKIWNLGFVFSPSKILLLIFIFFGLNLFLLFKNWKLSQESGKVENFVHFFLFFTFSFDQFFILSYPYPARFFWHTKKKKSRYIYYPTPRGALLPHCHLLLKRTSPLTHIAAPPSLHFISSQPQKNSNNASCFYIYTYSAFQVSVNQILRETGGVFKMIWANIILFWKKKEKGKKR